MNHKTVKRSLSLMAISAVLLANFGAPSALLYGQDDTPVEKTQSASQKQPATKPAKPESKPDLPPLEEMLSMALERNPDIKLAEARVRAAGAELERTRLAMVQKVIEVRQAWQAQKDSVELTRVTLQGAERKLETIKRFRNAGATEAFSPVEVDESQLAFHLAKVKYQQQQSKLAEIEANWPYLFSQGVGRSNDQTEYSELEDDERQSASTPDVPQTAVKEKASGLPTLEEMLETVPQHHPEAKFAQAKVAETMSELNRTKLDVIQRVVSLRQQWYTQFAMIEETKTQLANAQNQFQLKKRMVLKGFATPVELAAVQAQLDKQKISLLQEESKLAEIKAIFPYLLGQPDPRPTLGLQIEGNASFQAKKQASSVRKDSIRALDLPVYGQSTTRTADPHEEVLRKKLNEVTEFEFRDITLTAAVDYISDLHGIGFFFDKMAFREANEWANKKRLTNEDATKMLVNLTVSDVHVAAALQAIEDQLKVVRFVVRDYGILVTTEEGMPKDGVSVKKFSRRTGSASSPWEGIR